MADVGTKRREDLCRKFYCTVKQDTVGTTRYLAFPMRCKSWDCPTCRQEKAADYRERMAPFFKKPELFFYTFTYYHSCSPAEAWATYNAAWNRLRTNLAKQCGSFQYVRVLESHEQSPYPHLHVVTDREFPPTIIGPAMIAAGFGFQMKCERVKTARAMSYITKYLTKEWTNEESKSLRKTYRCRIISCSRGLLSPVNRGGGWEQLLLGTGLDTCLEHIRMDYEWRTDARGDVHYERLDADFAEITVIWTDIDPQFYKRKDFDWQPDDWIPK